MKRFVVVGNGIAGLSCVEGIFKTDPTASVNLVASEPCPTYYRPLISYYLEGKTPREYMALRSDEFYDRPGLRVLYGRRAVAVSPSRRQVRLDDETVLDYDALCLATGSSPFVPPMEGLDGVEKQFSFMTFDDALELERNVDASTRVLIVGAGLIGLKCAEGLRDRVAKITICDLAPRVLSSILDEECADVMQKHLEANGMTFMLGDSVARFEGDQAVMKSGATVDFDALVLAVGVRPNISLARDAGCECGRAIKIDARMRTSVEGIYAAGDCTESCDVSSGATKIMALMPNARIQGACAGENMAGGSASFENAIPMNSIGFWGLHAMTAGSRVDPDDGGEVFIERDGSNIQKLFVKAGRLVGFMIIGDVRRAGIYTNLIRSRAPLESLDFETLKLAPSLASFDAQRREKMLGGLV